jgi:phage gp16-like protein
LCSDEQLGWGRWKESGGIVARFRRLWRVWSHVDRAHQDVLAAFYDTSKLGAFARTAGNLRSPTARKRRVLWYLECKDTTARRPEDADAPVWSADDEAEAEEAIQVAHEAWEEARAKVRGSEKTKSHSDTILTELGA